MNNNKNFRIMKFFEAVDKSSNGKGYVRLDMRGNRGFITVNVENLTDGKTASEVYLFKNREEKIKIGPINTKRGRLQRSIMLNGKDEPIENYNICGIVENDKVLMYTPIFMPPHVNQLSVLLSDERAEVMVEELAEEFIEDLSVNEIEEVVELEEVDRNIKSENRLKDEMPVQFEYLNQEHNVNVDIEQVDDEPEDVEQCGRSFKNEYERKLYSLLKEFESIKPLAHDINSIKWWKVTYDENSIYKGFLQYFNQIITTYYPYPMSNHITTCQTLLKRYGYYLFGIYEENGKMAKYVYGVPGKFTREQQPYRGVTGFKNWSYKNNNISGDYGFWLAFIDAETGAVSDAPAVE